MYMNREREKERERERERKRQRKKERKKERQTERKTDKEKLWHTSPRAVVRQLILANCKSSLTVGVDAWDLLGVTDPNPSTKQIM